MIPMSSWTALRPANVGVGSTGSLASPKKNMESKGKEPKVYELMPSLSLLKESRSKPEKEDHTKPTPHRQNAFPAALAVESLCGGHGLFVPSTST